VYGVVKAADDVTYIEGAALKLEASKFYSTTSGALGTFEFTDVAMANNYTLTATYPGYQVNTSSVQVSGHTNVGTIYMLEIPYPPTNVVATPVEPEEESVKITWGLPAILLNGGAGITGYKLWRLIEGQEDEPDTWAKLTNNPVPALEFYDYSWVNAPQADSRWAVKTCYYGGVESEPEFSNTLPKYIKVPYTINITTNSGDSPVGADVKLAGDFTYTATAASNSVIFDEVVLGTYTLTVKLAGFHDYTATLDITETGVHLATLIEIIKAPYGLKIDTLCNTATLTWNHDAGGKHLNAFTVYLDGVAKAAGITETEYVFTDLGDGDYTAGVEANYSSGNSEIVTIDFTILCTGVIDPESGYNLYPNPASNYLTVERENSSEATIDIYNAMGMHIATYETIEAKFDINVAALSAGTYFIRVTEGTTSSVKSFVKK
jgi:hypothetical protein